MSIVAANKRRKIAEKAMQRWIIDLAKASDEHKGDTAYLNELIDALTMAAHILKSVDINLWDDEADK